MLLLATLAEILVRFGCRRISLSISARRRPTLQERCLWQQQSSRLILKRMGLALSTSGRPPACGLVLSNHLGYLDILFHGASMPCVFVSKAEVRRWPLIGLIAHCAGTIFLDRERATGAARAATKVEAALAAGIPVLLFPEGTSTDGAQVLPFHPFLLQSAVKAKVPVTPAALRYAADTCAERELCFHGAGTLGPHLFHALGERGVRAHIEYGPSRQIVDRKSAAVELREWVVAARARAMD